MCVGRGGGGGPEAFHILHFTRMSALIQMSSGYKTRHGSRQRLARHTKASRAMMLRRLSSYSGGLLRHATKYLIFSPGL